MKGISIACILLLLVGCKVNIETTINLSDLQRKEQQLTQALIDFEVSACNSFEDSRVESSSLIQIKQKAPYIFHNAQFIECYNKQFSSFARFSIPIVVGQLAEQGKQVKADIYLYSNEAKKTVAGLYIQPAAMRRIKASQKDSFNNLDFNIRINLRNDTKTPLKGHVLSAIVHTRKQQDFPALLEKINLLPKEEIKIDLSDVSIAKLMKDNDTLILMDEDFFNKK